MPRVRNTASDPLDFCKRHMPTEVVAESLYGDMSKTGEGPDGRGNCYTYDDDHPDYQGEDYKCLTCKRPLGKIDN